MNLDEMIADAIDRRDVRMAGKVAMTLWMSGRTYNDIFLRIRRVRPEITVAEWDAMLAESDNEEG